MTDQKTIVRCGASCSTKAGSCRSPFVAFYFGGDGYRCHWHTPQRTFYSDSLIEDFVARCTRAVKNDNMSTPRPPGGESKRDALTHLEESLTEGEFWQRWQMLSDAQKKLFSSEADASMLLDIQSELCDSSLPCSKCFGPLQPGLKGNPVCRGGKWVCGRCIDVAEVEQSWWQLFAFLANLFA